MSRRTRPAGVWSRLRLVLGAGPLGSISGVKPFFSAKDFTMSASAPSVDLTPSANLRRHDLDALRAFAMLLGIALHASLSFSTIPWVVHDSRQSELYSTFMLAVHGFRMPLFFLVSGFFTAMLCAGEGWRRCSSKGRCGSCPLPRRPGDNHPLGELGVRVGDSERGARRRSLTMDRSLGSQIGRFRRALRSRAEGDRMST